MAEKLTNTFVTKLKPESKRYWISDLKCPGLTLSVYPSGTKTYYYRYKHKGSRKNNSIKIGNASILSVDAARKSTATVIGDLAKGFDPKERQSQKLRDESSSLKNKSLQLFAYIDEYYDPYAKKNSVTADEIIKCLKREFGFIKYKRIDEISGADIDLWRSKREGEITFSTIKRIYTYLKACINTAVKHYKLIQSYELQTYTLKRRITERVNPPKLRYLSDQEESRLNAALDKRDTNLRNKRVRYVEWQSKRAHNKKQMQPFSSDDIPDHITPIIVLAYHTGYDLGDIFDLDWQLNIDFPNSQISKVRNKTKHKQDNPQPVVVPMTKRVKSILKQWGKQHGMTGRVFPSPVTAGRLDNITKAWNSLKADAGLENFRFKDFRHTYGSWLAINGVDLLDIRDLMGHSDIKTTQIYAHLCPKRKKEAVVAVFS